MSKTTQRGSAWSVKLAISIYKVFGYKAIYYLLYPITFFYYLFLRDVKKSLKIYYKHLDIDFTNKIYYEHLRMFSIAFIDRFATKIDKTSYIYEYDDYPELLRLFNNGLILIQSHFGGWAGSSNISESSNKIHIVMQESMLETIKTVEDSIESKMKTSIIDLNQGTIVTSVQIANALMQNEVVAIMGDRALNPQSTVSMEFLGEVANFNKNPFQIAYKMDKPIVLFFVVFISMRKYKIKFIQINMNKSLNQDDAINQAVSIYVNEYESIVKQYPHQWFNLYDFWSK